MTSLEKAAYEALLDIRAAFGGPKISRPSFQTAMGRIRDVIRMFEYASFSCATGKHAGKCTCKPAECGRHIRG